MISLNLFWTLIP